MGSSVDTSFVFGQNNSLNESFNLTYGTSNSFGGKVLVLPPLHLATVVITAILLILAMLLGMIGNMLVLISFIRNRALRTATNAMVVNLSAADLIACTAAAPLALAVVLASTADLHLPSQLCYVQSFFSTLCNLVTLLMLVGISVDRWLNITYPFTSCDSKTIRVGICISFAWITGLTVAIAEAVLPTTSHFHERCLGREGTNRTDGIPLQTYTVVPVGLVALVVVTVCYALIVRAVRIHMKRRLTRLRPRRPVIFVQEAPENTAPDKNTLPKDCSVIIVPATPSIFSPSAASTGHSEAFFASPASSPGPGLSSGTSSQITLQTPIASPCNSRLPSPVPPSPMASYYSSSTCTPNTTSSPCMPDTDIEELTEDSTPKQPPNRQHFLFDHENIIAHQHGRQMHGHEQRHAGKFMAIPEDQEGDRPMTTPHAHELHTFGNFLSVPTPMAFREKEKKLPQSCPEGYELENLSELSSPNSVPRTPTDFHKCTRRSSMSAIHGNRSIFKRRVSWTHADSYDLSQEGNFPLPNNSRTNMPAVEQPATEITRRKLSWTLPDLTKRFRVRPNSNREEGRGKSSDTNNDIDTNAAVSRIDLPTESARYYRDDESSLPDVTCPPSTDSNVHKPSPNTEKQASGPASSTSRDGKSSGSECSRKRKTRLAERSPSQRLPDAMDKSAAIRSVYIILAFIVAWIPLPVALLLEYLVNSPVVYNFETVAYVLMLCTRVVHPLLYACFHKGFRSEFRRSLRGLRCTKEAA